jgi:hypothetical protein
MRMRRVTHDKTWIHNTDQSIAPVMKKLKHSFEDLLSSVTSAPPSSEIEHIILSTTPKKDNNLATNISSEIFLNDMQTINATQESGVVLQKLLSSLNDFLGDDTTEEEIVSNLHKLSETEVCFLARKAFSKRHFLLSRTIIQNYMKVSCGEISFDSVLKVFDFKEPTKHQIMGLRLWTLLILLSDFDISEDNYRVIEKNRRMFVRKSLTSSNFIEYSMLLDCLYIISAEYSSTHESINPFL